MSKSNYELLLDFANGRSGLATFSKLLDQNDPYLDHVVAGNDRAPVKILEILSRRPDPVTRARVAWNPKTSQRIRQALSMDSDVFVRRSVAFTGTSLQALSKDPSNLVRQAVADKATPELLNTLLHDPCSRVRKIARRRWVSLTCPRSS